ncbi:MAG: hypothetical protein L6R28_08110 [Planctomycetes bacterium]|nr:hypothetical protein [Planctomycetota bacterium]
MSATPAPASFRIPDTRLPFVNGEIALIEREGKELLVTGTVGGTGGRIYLIDPETGACEYRALPGNEIAAYMLKTGIDGALYIGLGNGDLAKFEPCTGAFEYLVKGKMHSLTWGGCVTEQYIVWSASPHDACVYDWCRNKLLHVFSPADLDTPPARYGHTVLECPDGRVLLMMNVPQARLVLLEPESGKRESIVPDALRGVSWTRGGRFLDGETLGFFAAKDFLLYRYPSFELLARLPNPTGAEGSHMQSCLCAGRLYTVSNEDGALWRLKDERDGFERAAPEGADAARGVLYALHDHLICSVDATGTFRRHDLDSGETFAKELDAWGPLGAHALCAVAERQTVFGAPFINMRFWQIDAEKGEGRDLGRAGPGGGQVNQILWDPQTQRVLLSCYTSCTLNAFDPSQPSSYPENPKTIAKVGEEQMRPLALAHDGRHVWMASSAHYGLLGGAVSRIDPTDTSGASVKTWRHLVKDQTPNALVADPEREHLYASTQIYADCESAPPSQTTARLVAFDTRALKTAAECAPFDGCPQLHVLALLPKGEVLCRAYGEANRLFAWDPQKNTTRDLGVPPDKFGRQVAPGPGGALYVSSGAGIGRLHVEASGVRIEPLAEGTGAFLHVAGGKLWYASGFEVYALDLPE